MSTNIKSAIEKIKNEVRENRTKNRRITSTGIVDSSCYNEEIGLINCVRSIGTEYTNIEEMRSKKDGIESYSKSLANSFGRDEHDAVLKAIKGVCKSETKPDGRKRGILDWSSNPAYETTGFFVDLNAKGSFTRTENPSNEPRKLLYKNKEGQVCLDRLLSAIGMAWGDKEPRHLYLRVETNLLEELKEEKLIEVNDMISEGGMKFYNMCNGQFRVFYDRPPFKISSPLVRPESTEATIVIMPKAIAFDQIWVENPIIATCKKENKFDIWHKYGFGIRPKGYRWTGRELPGNEDFRNGGYWNRLFEEFNPMILPIFHS